MSKFKVGAGIASLDYPIEKYPAMTFSHVCEDKYDDCSCRAVAIETDDCSILLFAFELSDIPEVPELEARLSEATGIPEENIIITVTHNHTSPCDRGSRSCRDEEQKRAFRKEFMEIELASALTAARMAMNSLQDAKYGYGEINSYVASNEIARNPKIGLYIDKNGNGYVDNTLSIVEFTDMEDRPICFLMNHPCHATFAMEKDENGKFATSGNFTGITSRFLEDYYGNGVVALWTAGASGNLHPTFPERIVIDYTDGYKSNVELPGGAAHMMMEQTGRQHAIDAINCISRIGEFKDEMVLRHSKGSIIIPTQKNTTSKDGPMMPWDRPEYGTGVRSDQDVPAAPFKEPVIVDDPEHPSELRMEALVIGDIAFICLGCELFCQIGRDIKNAIPAEHTVVITHTPGYVGDNPHAVGYIVDRSSIGSGNHKLYRNLIPGAYDDMIVKLAQKLYEEAIS